MSHFGSYEPVNNSAIRVCCLTMNMADRLRLLACPPEVVPLIRAAIKKFWHGGIQGERAYHGSHEFKLIGNPWHAYGEDAIASRKLLAAILKTMGTLGWNLTQSTDVSKREGDKDSLFFEEGVADPDARVFVVSFNQRNRLRLIDAPDLLPFVEEAVTQYWPKGIEERTELNGCNELKLKGNPWYPIGADAVHSKLLLCKVVANFRSIGYKLYASVDLSYGTFKAKIWKPGFFEKFGMTWSTCPPLVNHVGNSLTTLIT
ncbi:hypothetical protein Ocin01_05757 [Orchesella cincta]|uniref:Uncharacterized protein n=1 Tax=Orchesella cincta TaxID=48709 RepID=A0A1D2N766_ORCCI|nr:hypothetical protein Ocin01_05757 [Orchesella cincta]